MNVVYAARTSPEQKEREMELQRRRRAAAGPADPALNRRYNLRKYRITPEDYDLMMIAQGNVCAICGEPPSTLLKGVLLRLAVDHDHKSGKVRMLLCTHCNRGIGCFRDRPDLLVTAAEYIRLHSSYSGLA